LEADSLPQILSSAIGEAATGARLDDNRIHWKDVCMNKVVALVNEWDRFERSHPDGELADFCRYILARREQEGAELPGRPADTLPKIPDTGMLLKTMGRILAAFQLYHKAAMAKTELPFPDAFFYMNFLRQFGELRKTDLINQLLNEYTTGMEAINKLIKAGLITERPDQTDRRAKLISLSKKGEEVLLSCYEYVGKSGEMIFKGVGPETVKLCIGLLSGVERRHSALAIELKNRDFDEIYATIMGDEVG